MTKDPLARFKKRSQCIHTLIINVFPPALPGEYAADPFRSRVKFLISKKDIIILWTISKIKHP